LLAAPPGPFNLEVDVKHDDRVVGSWSLECNPQDATGLRVSQVRADLYVCGSASGNPRESGAFLAISSWWVDADDPTQLESLYAELTEDVIERLSSLLGNDARERIGEPQSLVLYLLDVRRRDRRTLSLAVLEAALLLEIAGGNRVAGVDLRVAHGKGVGSLPAHDAAGGGAPTLPMPLVPHRRGGDLRGQVFVRETVSPANVKWNRRASDRSQASPATDQSATVTAWGRLPGSEAEPS
jgi:hypothetical protein